MKISPLFGMILCRRDLNLGWGSSPTLEVCAIMEKVKISVDMMVIAQI